MTQPTEWKLEKELCQIAGEEALGPALESLNLVADRRERIRLVPGDGWHRGGAETYIFRFSLKTDSGARDCILKACTPSSIALPIEDLLREWIRRRELLAGGGVETPVLYGVGKGIILEEYIPFEFSEALEMAADSDEREILLRNAAFCVVVIERLRFDGVSPWRDLRSRGGDAVMVDFGEDLGPADRTAQVSSTEHTALLKQLASWGLDGTGKDGGVFFQALAQLRASGSGLGSTH